MILAERQKAAAVVGVRSPRPLQVMLDPIERERIVARGDGRVRREDGGGPHAGERFVEAHAFGDVLVDALQDDEPGMALVQVPHGRRDAERADRAHAADAKNDLLLETGFAIAAVETRGEIAILRGVFLESGVEQVKVDAADPDFPDVG